MLRFAQRITCQLYGIFAVGPLDNAVPFFVLTHKKLAALKAFAPAENQLCGTIRIGIARDYRKRARARSLSADGQLCAFRSIDTVGKCRRAVFSLQTAVNDLFTYPFKQGG